MQADHVRPVHAGGPTIPVNLAPLCERCNRVKSCYWPGHGYGPFEGAADEDLAFAILDSEIIWLRDHHDEAELGEHIWPFYGKRDAHYHYAQQT